MRVVKQYGNICVDKGFPDDPEDLKKLQDILTDTLSDIISKKLQPGALEILEEVFQREDITM